jgi:hypothetical protein
VDATRRDAAFQEALRTMAAFWSYSPFSQWLIVLQRRDARRVAGRRTWERLGRRVKPGEVPLVVLAPTRGGFGFVEVPVFDVAQTRGRRLAALRTELRSRSRHVATLLRAAAWLDVAVERRRLPVGVGGRSLGGRIEVDVRIPIAEQVRVLAHELAHEVLHQEERVRAAALKRPRLTRSPAERETEPTRAEGPRPHRARARVHRWGGDGATVLRSMSRIKRAAGACPCVS